jgi:phytanoyl-CoA hydroxylase
MLNSEQLNTFRQTGHVTVPSVFSAADVRAAVADIETWSDEFLARISDEQKDWFLEKGMGANAQLRKLDNPVFHREWFQRMAKHARLVEIVEQIVGPGVSVFFSQVFMKPPEGGGPKPVHQDNFYFGPDDPDATLTVWIAIDDATVENGCLYYGDGSHQHSVIDHVAPPDEPFNLQVSADQMNGFTMTPAAVPSGGISFHHGNTLHQSSANTSPRPRRAVAMHYLRNDARLVSPTLAYDDAMNVRIT